MLLTFDSYAQIPDKLHIFYSNAFETMFFKHDATKSGFKRQLKSDLSFDDFKNVFSIFCFHTYMKEQYQFSYSELSSLLDEINKQRFSFIPSDFISDLTDSVCVMFKDGLNYCFSHRSFQEYFTALHIQNISDQQQSRVFKYIFNNPTCSSDKLTLIEMLIDMSQDRFEKNTFIEILTEIENEFCGELDLYDNYFRYLIYSVNFFLGENGNISFGRVIDFENPNYLKIECIFNIIYRCRLQEGLIDTYNDYDFNINSAAINNIEFLFSYDNQLLLFELIGQENSDIYQLIKGNTWIGASINRATTLLASIKKKQEYQVKQLEELLSF